MSLAQVLDFVYILHLEMIERRIEQQQLHAVIYAAGGAEGVEPPPTFDDARAEFDEYLESAPVAETAHERATDDFLSVMFGRRRR
jgi:hypothetical protein